MSLRRTIALLAVLALPAVPAARAQGSLNAIWGSGPDNVWAAGDGPAALRFDGHAWNPVPYGVPVAGTINALWGTGPRDVFAAGEGGTLLHWNGQAWALIALPIFGGDLVALAGRSATDVFALKQTNRDDVPPTLYHWDGHAWTDEVFPIPFRANALALQGADVLVAGFVTVDPTPSQRRIYGVLARKRAGRWTLHGWDGKAVNDPVIAGAGWSRLYVAGNNVLLAGEREGGDYVQAFSTGAAWTQLPPALTSGNGARVAFAFLGADGIPVALNATPQGLERYRGGRWVAVEAPTPYSMAMQAQGNPQAMAQLNPEVLAVQMMAWDFGEARAAWGPSSDDFYVATSNGRLVRVQGSAATIVFEAGCANPTQASMDPVCRALLQQRPPTPIPMPTRRPKP